MSSSSLAPLHPSNEEGKPVAGCNMPSTIPYDPSLVLGSIVSQNAIDLLTQISGLQAPTDAAEEDLNALLTSRRSSDMTKSELANMGLDTTDISGTINRLNGDIVTAAKTFATAKMASEEKIRPLRSKIRTVQSSIESPVDYVKTQIKTMPLAADSININVQYFSWDSNKQSASCCAEIVSGFVSSSTKFLGTGTKTQMGAAAGKQVSKQMQTHDIRGTMVLSVSCTHKNAAVMAPFILNVDKGIKVWNRMFPGQKLLPTSSTDMAKFAAEDYKEGDQKLTFISGQTFGSSFVGMVHVLKSTSTEVSERLSSVATSLQRQVDAGAWFQKASGGFGVNATMGNDVKNLLSTQNISSHVTMICMGTIPSMVANDVKLGMEGFAKFDPQSNMELIASIQNATEADQGSVKASANAARTGQGMTSMKVGEIEASLSALAEIDDGKNKILDIDSMTTALDDYLKKAAEGTAGVPINYYLKDFTRQMLAEMWVAKYYPGQYMAIISDDSEKPAAADGGRGADGGGGA